MSFISDFKRKVHFAKLLFPPLKFPLVSRHIVKRLLSKMKSADKFRIVDIALSYNCNFRCEHCSARIMKKNARTMTLEDYKRLVNESKPLDILSWNITGGEPLLVEWLEDFIPILEPNKHYISIQTNCSLLTLEKARTFARLGVNCITTSLDSSSEENHDSFRHFKGSYGKVLEGVRYARKAGMRALVAITVTHQNLRSQDLVDVIELSNNEGAICLFNIAIPCGEWKNNNDVILRGDDREYLIKLMEKYPMTSTDHEAGRNAIGCPAGTEKVYITPYGDVMPCPFIHISFGNIFSESLVDIITRIRKIPEFSRYDKICVAGEDLNFHKNVLEKAYSSNKQYPVDYREIYGKLE